MSSRSLLLFALAGLMAFGAAFAVRGYIAGNKDAGPGGPKVLVAAVDIAQGSFVQEAKHLQLASWPQENMNAAYLREGQIDPAKFNGAVARRGILKGEPVTDSVLVEKNEGGFMSAVLEPGKRAVSIAVDATTGNAGFIFPGDRVDLIVTHRVGVDSASGTTSKQVLASETFIEDVRVLAVDQKTDNPDNAAMIAKTVTLEVSQRQAEKITVAKDLGKISLSLRSLSPEDGEAKQADKGGYTRDSDISRMLAPGTDSAVKVRVIHGSKQQDEVEFNRVAPPSP